MMARIAHQPFKFSDGTYVPPGTYIQVAAHATHCDEDNYTDPNEFKPFRFVDDTAERNGGRKIDMVSTHADFIAFGHGRHACPGRFFAAEMLKLMLAHIVMNYDVEIEGGHPKNMWIMASCIPSTTAEVMLRKR